MLWICKFLTFSIKLLKARCTLVARPFFLSFFLGGGIEILKYGSKKKKKVFFLAHII